jgi:hypothetical protein
MRQMALVYPPDQDIRLYGVDPRNKRDVQAMVRPEQLLNNCRIKVRLPNTLPRDGLQLSELLSRLQERGLVSRRIAVDKIAEVLRLDITSAEDMFEDIDNDQQREMRNKYMQQIAEQTLGELRQNAHNRGMNPDLINGERPYQLSSEGSDPLLLHEISGQTVMNPPELDIPSLGVSQL